MNKTQKNDHATPIDPPAFQLQCISNCCSSLGIYLVSISIRLIPADPHHGYTNGIDPMMQQFTQNVSMSLK
ncbi:hypothetical protein M0813_29059 [Anaeramoeba flamelloides]|uniref:Uncharacterized protein n=1 Tax=Anaeramoeba flamelloides TaxID=1746091 RepID=A0ABQ8XUM9_9EUKA|nr:hypothetical protein M0813_29059 [Anaeramoeba flamelloides]